MRGVTAQGDDARFVIGTFLPAIPLHCWIPSLRVPIKISSHNQLLMENYGNSFPLKNKLRTEIQFTEILLRSYGNIAPHSRRESPFSIT